MSVAELPVPYDDGGGPPTDRTPPQDVAAEQSVLGAMMLSKDAIADVVEVLREGDFYRPAHATIYDAIITIYGKGDPADAVTVAAELTRVGEIGRIGGASYLHTLVSLVPTAANAGYYAAIVKERAILRRLVEAGTRIVQMGYAGEGDVDDVVDRAQAEVYEVTERRSAEDYLPLRDLMDGALTEIEAIANRGGQMVGVPTGFADLDALTNGLHPGQLIIVAARPAIGKALALDTPIPTPTGWTTMGEIQPGDDVLDDQGRPTRVVAVSETWSDRPCYRVTFSDGSSIVADEEHEWLTETRASRKSAQAAATGYNRMRNQRTFAEVRTTRKISETLRCPTKDARLNHSIVNTRPLDLPEADLPIAPYVLGVWLGDGTSAAAHFTSADPEISMFIEAEGLDVPYLGNLRYGLRLRGTREIPDRECEVCGVTFRPKAPTVRTCGRTCGGKLPKNQGRAADAACPDCGGRTTGVLRCRACERSHGSFQAVLRSLGVLDNKHIPPAYLRGSEDQRRALLAGLLDTDGTITSQGNVQLTTTSRRLARDAYELIVSLGYRCSISTKRVNGRTEASSTAFNLNFTTLDEVFRLPRKALLHKERMAGKSAARTGSRFITSVTPVPSVPVRCIQVSNASHLYLAGRAMVPTHNSTLAVDIARSASIRNGLTSVIFSLEMGRNEILMRLLSAEAQIALHHMRSGNMSDNDWQKLATKMGVVSEAPLFIDDSPNLTMMEIRAKCRRLKQRHDLRLVVVDYMQLMTSGKKVESRQQEVSEFSRSLKLLAKELDVPVIAVSQLNRGPEQRTDKRPMLSDLRESGCLTASTRILRADIGSEVTIGELMESGERLIPVWSLDDSLRYVPKIMTHVFATGRKEVFTLTTASGRVVELTANHPLLTYHGWRSLGELEPGDRIATPRHVPAPEVEFDMWSDDKVAAAARAPMFRVPREVFCLPKQQIALFLRHLWATDGSILVNASGRGGRVYYASTSRRLADDVARLLLRFGITARIRTSTKEGYRPSYTVDVSGAADQKVFLRRINAHGERGEIGRRLLSILETIEPNTNRDTVPREVWENVKSVMSDKGMTHREFASAMGTSFCGSTMWKHAPSRERLGRVATVLESADLELMATNDVHWDEIVSIASIGEQEVYDATVPGTHNFIADGVAVHNSLEQDADMVILLHREDAYERESPRAGEADFIVAKHRNGPTSTITVAFQGHYSRFVDMAQ